MTVNSKRRYNVCDPVLADMEVQTSKKAKQQLPLFHKSRWTPFCDKRVRANHPDLLTVETMHDPLLYMRLEQYAELRKEVRSYVNKLAMEAGNDTEVRQRYYQTDYSKYGQLAGVTKLGRMRAPGHSLQNVSGAVLETIVTKDDFLDIDVECCHPTIMVQLFHHLDIPMCKMFVNDRPSFAETFEHKTGLGLDYTKKVFASLMYGGDSLCGFTKKRWDKMKTKPGVMQRLQSKGITTKDKLVGIVKRIPWVKQITAEIRLINDEARAFYPSYWDAFNNKSREEGKNNADGSFLSQLLGDVENELLLSFLEFGKRFNIIQTTEDGALIDIICQYDGFKIRKEHLGHESPGDVLRGMEKFAYERVGIRCRLVSKPMTRGIDRRLITEICKERPVVVKSEKHAAEILQEAAMGYRLVQDGRLHYLRLPGSPQIYCDPKVVDMMLGRLVVDYNFVKENARGEQCPLSHNTHGKNGIVNNLKDICERIDGFNDMMWEESAKRVYYADGYVHIVGGKPTFHEGFEEDCLGCVIMIRRPYPRRTRELEALMEEIKTKLLDTAWRGSEEQCAKYLSSLSRAVFGHYEDKAICVVEGLRDSGKGTFNEILKAAIGAYVAADNIEEFGSNPGSMMDEPRKQAFMIRSEYTKVNNTSEGSLKIACGSKIKKYSSGGDWVACRLEYGFTKPLRVLARLFLNANQVPDFHPSDCMKHALVFTMPVVFASLEEINEAPQEDRGHMMKADPDIKDWCKRQDVGDAFFHILCDAYSATKIVPSQDMITARMGLVDDQDKSEIDQYVKYHEHWGRNLYIINTDLDLLLDHFKMTRNEFQIRANNKRGKIEFPDTAEYHGKNRTRVFDENVKKQVRVLHQVTLSEVGETFVKSLGGGTPNECEN